MQEYPLLPVDLKSGNIYESHNRNVFYLISIEKIEGNYRNCYYHNYSEKFPYLKVARLYKTQIIKEIWPPTTETRFKLLN